MTCGPCTSRAPRCCTSAGGVGEAARSSQQVDCTTAALKDWAADFALCLQCLQGRAFSPAAAARSYISQRIDACVGTAVSTARARSRNVGMARRRGMGQVQG